MSDTKRAEFTAEDAEPSDVIYRAKVISIEKANALLTEFFAPLRRENALLRQMVGAAVEHLQATARGRDIDAIRAQATLEELERISERKEAS